MAATPLALMCSWSRSLAARSRTRCQKVTGVEGIVTIDATNSPSGPHGGFESLALEVQSIVGGPTAKCFNTNFAVIYDQIADQRVAPTSVFAADPDARAPAEQLIRDAGFDRSTSAGSTTRRPWKRTSPSP